MATSTDAMPYGSSPDNTTTTTTTTTTPRRKRIEEHPAAAAPLDATVCHAAAAAVKLRKESAVLVHVEPPPSYAATVGHNRRRRSDGSVRSALSSDGSGDVSAAVVARLQQDAKVSAAIIKTLRHELWMAQTALSRERESVQLLLHEPLALRREPSNAPNRVVTSMEDYSAQGMANQLRGHIGRCAMTSYHVGWLEGHENGCREALAEAENVARQAVAAAAVASYNEALIEASFDVVD